MDLIDLSLGVVQLEDIRRIDGKRPAGSSYGPAGGFPVLKSALATLEGVDNTNVVITTGASLGLVATLSHLQKPGNVLIPRPCFPSYPGMIKLLGLTPRTYAVEQLTSQGDAAEHQILSLADPNTRAVIVNTPGNPMGNVVGPSDMLAIVEAARSRQMLVIVDEVYSGLVYDECEQWKPHGAEPGVVRVKSFSKIFQMPGERLGYVICTPEMARRIEHAHWLLAMSAPVPAQINAAQAIVHGFNERIGRMTRLLRRSRDRMLDVLRERITPGLATPPGGIFLWIEFAGSKLTADELATVCEVSGGVRTVPGTLCGVDSPPALRCSFAVPEARALDAASRIANALESVLK